MSARSSRPRPRSPLVLDTGNAYARLGVSPLASIDEIKAALNKKRREALEARRSGTKQALGEAEAEMERLQDIEKEIGTPARRAVYDAEHPQNELLTVQPSVRDRAFSDATRLEVVTRWLAFELGAGALPTLPTSLDLVAPKGIDPELERLLVPFERDAKDRTSMVPARAAITMADMGRLDESTGTGLEGQDE